MSKRRPEQSYKRVCSQCGGRVSSHHEYFKVQHPARDSQGKFIWKTVVDKETGIPKIIMQMIQFTVRGLGHWSCSNGCKPCKVRTSIVRAKDVDHAAATA